MESERNANPQATGEASGSVCNPAPRLGSEPEQALPSLPPIEPQEAVDRLLRSEWSDRVVEGCTIRDLQAVLEMFASQNPNPDEYKQILFRNAVIENADVKSLNLPFHVCFQDVGFRDTLSFDDCNGPAVLNIDGGVLSRASIDRITGEPQINIAWLDLESLYVARSLVRGVSIENCRIASRMMLVGVKVGRLFVMQSEIGATLHFQDLESEEIYFQNTTLHAGFTLLSTTCHGAYTLRDCTIRERGHVGSSTCGHFCLAGTVCHRVIHLTGLGFGEIDVSGTRIDGGLLVDYEQLRNAAAKAGWRPWKGSWDTPSRVVGDGSSDPEAVRNAADQLLTLREAFRHTASMSLQEDYCTYRLAELHRRIRGRRTLGALNRFFFGYLLLPGRVFTTVLLAILIFAALFALGCRIGAGDVMQINDATSSMQSVFSDGAIPGLLRCVYFSTITITTVGYGDMHPTGAMKALSMLEALLGVFLCALFVVAMARQLLRW